jgi:hypothetical protein
VQREPPPAEKPFPLALLELVQGPRSQVPEQRPVSVQQPQVQQPQVQQPQVQQPQVQQPQVQQPQVQQPQVQQPQVQGRQPARVRREPAPPQRPRSRWGWEAARRSARR